MKLKNKLLSLLLAGIMIFSAVSWNSCNNVKAENNDNNVIRFFEYLCAANNVEYNSQKIVTRAEYAAILANLLRIDCSNNQETASGFEDVDSGNSYVNEINAIVERQYMEGISEKLFAPEQNLTLTQAVKVLADMMGYKVRAAEDGGYPEAYKKYAQTLGLVKGINVGFNDYVKQKDIALLIYNALDARTLNVVYDGSSKNLMTDEDKTFMTEVLRLDKITGTLTDNGVTGIYHASAIGQDSIIVENILIGINQETNYVRDFIGRSVVCYITQDDEPTLIYANLSGRDDSVTFDIGDFENYTSSAISYYNGSRTVTKQLADNAVMIYNGAAMEAFDKNIFNFENGSVTLVSNNSAAELIIVEKHDYMHVSTVDTENEIIYSSLIGNDKRAGAFDKKDYDYCAVYNSDGSQIAFGEIAIGSVVDIVANKPAARITVVNNKIEGFTVKSINEKDGKTYISNGSEEYVISNEYLNSPYAGRIEVNVTYTMWLGTGNLVVWLKKGDETASIGYVVKSYREDVSEKNIIKLYDLSGKMVRYELNDKVTVLNSDEKKGSYKADNVRSGLLNGYEGVIKYKLNSENIITYIEFPTDNKSANGQLHKIYDQKTDNGTWTGDGGFQGLWFYDNNTKFISVPADKSNDRLYENVSLSGAVNKYQNANTRDSVAYTSKPNSVIAEYVVFLEEKVEAAIVGDKKIYVVVESISEEINDDDEIILKITGTKAERGKCERVEMYSRPDAVTEADGSAHSAFENITDSMRTKENGELKRYNVETGDIIRCIYDDRYYVSAADLAWRMTESNPTSQNGRKGWIIGSNGYHIKGEKNGNPYGILSNGNLQPYSEHFMAEQSCRITYGTVIRVEDGIVQMTTADLTDPGTNIDNISSDFAFYNVNLEGAAVVAADYDGKKITSKVGSADDIKSYENVGSDCSRILIINHWGVYIVALIINGGSY